MKKFSATCLFTIAIFSSFVCAEQDAQERAHLNARTAIHFSLPESFDWKDGPPALPAGAKSIILEGDPAKSGPFTMRARLPAGYKIPPHRHPADEKVTVISGQLKLGHGDKLDAGSTTVVPAGGFALIPAGHHHFAVFDQETELQLHGMGPWNIIYLNPKDDPRKKTSK